jgi:hypothetical protein
MPTYTTEKQANPGFTQGSSYIYDYGTSAQTRTAVSQKVRILTAAHGANQTSQVGVLSSFQYQESKTVEPVMGIGFGDKIAELVPGVTQPATASIEKTLLYLLNLWQAMGYAAGIDGMVRSLRHHRWPFDIETQEVFSSVADSELVSANVGGFGGENGQGAQAGVKRLPYPANVSGTDVEGLGHTAIITLHEGCWFQDYSRPFSRDQAIIMESGSVMITDSHDFASVYGEFMNTGNDPSRGQLGSKRFENYNWGGTNPLFNNI